jgi:hypothetical protein
MWHIAKDGGVALHESITYVTDLPYTISFAIRKCRQIDSFYELPEKSRPPKSLWDKPQALKEWMDRDADPNKQTEFTLNIPESQVEG